MKDLSQIVAVGFPGSGEWAMAALVDEEGMEKLFWIPVSNQLEIGEHVNLHGEHEGIWTLAYLSSESLVLGGTTSAMPA